MFHELQYCDIDKSVKCRFCQISTMLLLFSPCVVFVWVRVILVGGAEPDPRLCESCEDFAWSSLLIQLWTHECSNNSNNVMYLYRVSHKKRNGRLSVACDLKVPYLFTSSNQATPAEENDIKIIKFDWVILILWPFVKTQSFSNFAWFFATDERRICWEWPFIVVFWGSPLIHVNKRNTVQRDSPKHHNERLFPT